jgi:hypothetical protein
MIDQWHALVEQRNPKKLSDLLADDATLFSPVIHTPVQGKQMVQLYLTAAFHTFLNGTFKYQPTIVTGNKAVLEFTTEIDGILVNGIDMITWNDEDKITEFKVMIRPLKAINLINDNMTAMLGQLKSKMD